MAQAKLSHTEMTDQELLENQAELQSAASKVLNELELLPLLEKFGQVVITGSMKLGLMVWPDLDLELVTTERPKVEDILEIAKTLMVKQGMRHITLSHHLDNDEGLPDGLYVGPKYTDQAGRTWQIDIWVVPESVAQTRLELMDLYSDKLDDETRGAILKIKQVLSTNPKYHREISSKDLYDSVLIEGVRNLDDFVGHLSKTGRTL